MAFQARKGFTLIELMVVIALIGMIAAVALVMLSGTSSKSRDSRREEDIKSLQSALNLYINQYSAYPVCSQEAAVDGKTDCLSTALLEAKVMQGVPKDPKFKDVISCGAPDIFAYCYQSNGTTYILKYHLETNSVHGKSAGWQTLTP